MTPVGTLWGATRQPLTKIILSVAALNDLELKQPEWGYSNKPAEFMAAFPYGKIPAFEDNDGFKLTEGAMIARHLSGLGTKVNLLGSDAKEAILADQWIHFSEHEIGTPTQNIMGMVFGFYGPFNTEILDKFAERLDRAMQYVESYLASRPSGYLVSDSVTLADFFLAAMAYCAAFIALGAAERKKYPHVFNHLARVTGDARVKHLWGTEHFTEVAAREPRPFPTL